MDTLVYFSKEIHLAIDAISPVFIYFIYWKRNNFNEDEAMSLTVAPPDDRSTYRLILVSQEEKPGVFEEFIFSGLTYYSEQVKIFVAYRI